CARCRPGFWRSRAKSVLFSAWISPFLSRCYREYYTPQTGVCHLHNFRNLLQLPQAGLPLACLPGLGYHNKERENTPERKNFHGNDPHPGARRRAGQGQMGDRRPVRNRRRLAGRARRCKGIRAARRSLPRRLDEGGETLLAFFRLDDEISLAFDALVHYAQRKSDEDTRVAAYQEMVSQVTRLAVELQSAAAFETPELLAIDDDTLARFYQEAPALENYRLCIDRVRRRKEHVLSDKEEALLAAAGEMAASPDDIYSMLNDADLTFPDAADKDGNR